MANRLVQTGLLGLAMLVASDAFSDAFWNGSAWRLSGRGKGRLVRMVHHGLENSQGFHSYGRKRAFQFYEGFQKGVALTEIFFSWCPHSASESENHPLWPQRTDGALGVRDVSRTPIRERLSVKSQAREVSRRPGSSFPTSCRRLTGGVGGRRWPRQV